MRPIALVLIFSLFHVETCTESLSSFSPSTSAGNESATGTFQAACVIYAKSYGKSPEGLFGSMGKLPDAPAELLQVMAWKTVQAEKGAKLLGCDRLSERIKERIRRLRP